ncbi:MAG TPA: hypothetical protein VFX36_03225 [Nitrospira sp.]|nr:hypothetical protein [Nitrospira sp.]
MNYWKNQEAGHHLVSTAKGIPFARTGDMNPLGTALGVLILSVTFLQQGCVAGAWVAAVGADSMRASDVKFQAFEESWVSKEQETAIDAGPALTSIAVMPVDGDEAMGARLTKLLRREIALRVVTPTGQQRPLSVAAPDRERALWGRELSRELAVDAVLYGYVIGATSLRSSEWGWKAEERRRLFLYMIDRDGHLLWKDELPFLIVTGTKPALEDSVQQALTRHFMDHVRTLRLDDLGYLPSKSS